MAASSKQNIFILMVVISSVFSKDTHGTSQETSYVIGAGIADVTGPAAEVNLVICGLFLALETCRALLLDLLYTTGPVSVYHL